MGECGFLFKVHSTLHTENKKTRNYGVNKGGWGGVDVNIGGWGWGGRQHRWVGMGWTSTWVGGGGVEVGWTSTLNTTCEIVVLATPLQNIETAAYHAYEHSIHSHRCFLTKEYLSVL